MTNVGARPLNLDICFVNFWRIWLVWYFLVALRQFGFGEYRLLFVYLRGGLLLDMPFPV